MMAKRCYYESLSVERTASDGDIKAAFRKVADDVDVVIVEIGGTVGDIESLPFVEVISKVSTGGGEDSSSPR